VEYPIIRRYIISSRLSVEESLPFRKKPPLTTEGEVSGVAAPGCACGERVHMFG
jgi:hypothetical protein